MKVTTLSGQPVARKISDIMLSPIENLPVTIFPSSQVTEKIEDMDRDRERIVVTHQVMNILKLKKKNLDII
jgi:hypothetical protein